MVVVAVVYVEVVLRLRKAAGGMCGSRAPRRLTSSRGEARENRSESATEKPRGLLGWEKSDSVVGMSGSMRWRGWGRGRAGCFLCCLGLLLRSWRPGSGLMSLVGGASMALYL